MAGSPLQTEEELLLVKEAIILPIMFDLLEKDMQLMKGCYLKMGDLYSHQLHRIQTSVLTQQYALRKEMRERQLKIVQVEQDPFFIRVSYTCRGYQHQMKLLLEVIDANIEVRLAAACHHR